MEKEPNALKNVFESPQKPSVFVLGGAKFGDSIKVLNRVLSQKIADMVILVGMTGGAFLVAMGVKPGEPNEDMLAKEVTPEALVEAKKLLEEKGDKILLPYDVAIEMEGKRKDIPVGELPVNYPILDIGKGSISKFAKVLVGAKTVFMSGPAGMIEKKSFALGTKELMTAVTMSKAYSVIGRGHTVAAAEAFGLVDSFFYVSTGGGALETYLLGEPLPAVKALKLAFKRLACNNYLKTGHQNPLLKTVPTDG